MLKYLLIIMFLFSCNPAGKDEEVKNNFEFDRSQLGKITFVGGDLDFGSIAVGSTHDRLIEIKNTGKLAVDEFEKFFDDENFNITFRFSGAENKFPGDNGTCEDYLDVQESCFLSFTYSPLVSETKNVEFKMVYDDGIGRSESTTRIKSFAGIEESLLVEPSIIDFEKIDFNTQKELVVTFSNPGELSILDINFSLDQDSETLYSLDFSDSDTTCYQNMFLDGGASCKLSFKVNSSMVSIYDNYTAQYLVDYKNYSDQQTIKSLQGDIITGVYSLEGILELTPILDYKNMISGSSKIIGLQVKNIGHNDAIVKSFSTSLASSLFNIDLSDCTNLNNENFNAPNEVIIEPGSICVLNGTLSPDSTMTTQTILANDLFFSYENNKTGIVNTTNSTVTANITKSGDIEVLDESDIAFPVWSIPAAFISGDSRIFESVDLKLSHLGETAVTLNSFQITGTGSEYLSISESCPSLLTSVDSSCTFVLNMNPDLTAYQGSGNTNISASLRINFYDESITPMQDPIPRSLYLPISGTLDVKSHLVFEKFNSTPSVDNKTVAQSAFLEKVYVRNIGALPESTFSIQISNATNYSAVNQNTVDSNGIRNCLDMNNSGDSLNPQQQCFYEMRVYSATNGTFTTNLTVNFGSGNTSDPFTVNTEVVDVAKISVNDVAPVDYASFITYNADYPGVGSSTSSGDGSVSRMYSGQKTVGNSEITTLPITANFDLAIIDFAYGVVGETGVKNFKLKNTGEFFLGINSVSVVDIYNETLSSPVTDGITYRTSSGCKAGASVNGDSDCTIDFDINYPDDDRRRAQIEIKYTVGDKTNPDDVNYIEYTSYALVYFQGYNASNAADLKFYDGASILSDIELIETYGAENSSSMDVKIQNDGVLSATDIHLALGQNGQVLELTGAGDEEIDLSDFVAGSGDLSEYFRVGTSVCNNSSGNDIFVSGDCVFDLTYLAKTKGETEYDILARYHNGVTYVSKTVPLKTIGLEPARLEIRNALGAFPAYNYNFEKQVIDETHVFEVKIQNTGESSAENILIDYTAGKFSFENASTQTPTCGTQLPADEICYLNLRFDPVFADIGTQISRNIISSYETGEILSAAPVVDTFEINALGFTENIRSKHYGWDEIHASGFNQDFADALNLNPANDYAPEDLGYISFSWYSMDDVDGAVDKYLIFRSSQDDIDIYNDTPVATIIPDGSNVYTHIDESVSNTPLKVWFYKVIPEKNGAISNILEADYPVVNLRIIIPNKFESLVHKYMMNREVCKSMDLADTTLSSFDPQANGCIYQNSFGADLYVDKDYDITVDFFETSSDYLTGSFNYNAPGSDPVQLQFNAALSHCESKSVNFNSTSPIFLNTFKKTLPNRFDHMIYSLNVTGETYLSSNCEYDSTDPLTGDAIDCQSKFLIEQSVGGLPEWSTSRVSGYGIGEQTNYTAFLDDVIQGFNFTKIYPALGAGANSAKFQSPSVVGGSCFDLTDGVLKKKGPNGCDTQNLAELTLDPLLAGPRVIDTSSLDTNSDFILWYFDSDVTSQNITLNSQVGGGDLLGQPAKNNSSRYTVEFAPSLLLGGARCVTRVGY